MLHLRLFQRRCVLIILFRLSQASSALLLLFNDHWRNWFLLNQYWGISVFWVFNLMFYLFRLFLNNCSRFSFKSTTHQGLGVLFDSRVCFFDDCIFFWHLICILLFKIDANLVVDETDHHSVVEGDHVGGFMANHLAVRLHKNEGAITAKLVFAFFTNSPTFFAAIAQVAVVSRDGLELDLYLTLHRSANTEEVLTVGFQDDFLLNQIFIFIWTDPGWAGAKGGWIAGVVFATFNHIVIDSRGLED